MPDLVQGSSSRGRRSSTGRDSLPFRYRPPYDITTYFRGNRVYFDTVRLCRLPCAGAAQAVPFGTGVGDTATGA